MMKLRICSRKAGVGFCSVTLTVFLSTASKLTFLPSWVKVAASPARASGFSMICSYVKTTSSAVKGSPSLHFTPWRSLKVYVLPSGETVQLSARAGSSL